MSDPSLLYALNRTLLLMRDDLVSNVSDQTLLSALTGTQVALVADAKNLATHSAQSAYASAAVMMARSGHKVHLLAPDVPSVGPQPPLFHGPIISELMKLGNDLLPTVIFSRHSPKSTVDIEVLFGDSPSIVPARRRIYLNADRWSATLGNTGNPWIGTNWPFGGLAASALVAAEAFKFAMSKLHCFAKKPSIFADQFRPCDSVNFSLAPASSSTGTDLGRFTIISAGAITHCLLFILSRILGVKGIAQIMDDDFGAITNLNRCALMRRSKIKDRKVVALAAMDLAGLEVKAVPRRYDVNTNVPNFLLEKWVLVGVDHIPSRWTVQKARPEWLGIGATTHWSSMASFHHAGVPCAGCLHPRAANDDEPLIPTVAFVSFFAALQLASYFVRAATGEKLPVDLQQVYLTSLRPDRPWFSPVAWRSDCPVTKHAA
jgi:hypothetical protein